MVLKHWSIFLLESSYNSESQLHWEIGLIAVVFVKSILNETGTACQQTKEEWDKAGKEVFLVWPTYQIIHTCSRLCCTSLRSIISLTRPVFIDLYTGFLETFPKICQKIQKNVSAAVNLEKLLSETEMSKWPTWPLDCSGVPRRMEMVRNIHNAALMRRKNRKIYESWQNIGK